MKKSINYEKVVDQFRQRYPDIHFCIEENDSDISYAYAHSRQRIVVLLTDDLDQILNNEAELIFILLHEVGHCETYNPDSYSWGSHKRELLADQYACLNGSTVKAGVAVLKNTGKYSPHKAKIRARIAELEKLKDKP